MKKKNILILGLTLLLLLIIIGFNSCKEEEYEFEYIFNNRSSYTIVIEVDSQYDFTPMRTEIKAGGKKTLKTNRLYPEGFSFTWYRKDTGGSWGVRYDTASSSFVNS